MGDFVLRSVDSVGISLERPRVSGHQRLVTRQLSVNYRLGNYKKRLITRRMAHRWMHYRALNCADIDIQYYYRPLCLCDLYKYTERVKKVAAIADFSETAWNFKIKYYVFIQSFYLRSHAKQTLTSTLAKLDSF